MKEVMDLVAKTFQGLEDVLAEELKNLGAEDVTPGKRMVAFRGDKTLLYKANFCCHTALRILKPMYKFTADDTDELYEAVKNFEWEKLLSPDQTFAIDSTVNSESFRHSKFVTYRVKDAIADYFTAKYGRRPSIRLVNADILINVHILNNEVTLSLDSSGEPLYKRGYRVAQTEAPINEVLAAGIILKTGWRGESNFIDPMCGSGTFLIEAALIAANINPGVYRQSFAFERWRDYEPELMDMIYNDDSQEREFEFKIFGSDISPKAIAIAQQNIKSAGVGKYIDLQVKPFQSYEEAPENGILITNPPYGERIAADDMDALYESIGERLKKVFTGYHAWILGYKSEYFDKIGLKPSVKIPILNGALECELREYVMFDGKYDDFRRQGNHIKEVPEEAEDQQPRKERRFSDDRRDRPRSFRDRRDRDRDDKDHRDRGRRDREHHDRDRRWDDRKDDRRSFRSDRRHDEFEKDKRGVSRRRPTNALEEKYHKPYSERMRSDKPFGERRPDRRDEKRDDFQRHEWTEEQKVKRAVQFRKPKLFSDDELEQKGSVVMRHRQKKENNEPTEN